MQNIVTFGVICVKIMYAYIKKSIAKNVVSSMKM